jgi:hypothetical protein
MLVPAPGDRWWWLWRNWWIGEKKLAGETEVLGENLPQHHFIHHKTHMTRPGFEPGPPRFEELVSIYKTIRHHSLYHYNQNKISACECESESTGLRYGLQAESWEHSKEISGLLIPPRTSWSPKRLLFSKRPLLGVSCCKSQSRRTMPKHYEGGWHS